MKRCRDASCVCAATGNTEPLTFLPDPVKDKCGMYKPFKDVFGKETTDSDRPSRMAQGSKSPVDVANDGLLKGSKVKFL